MKKEATTLRDVFEQHYLPERPDLKKTTIYKFRSAITRWERTTDNTPFRQATNETAATFRHKALNDGLAASTVNSEWRQLRALFRSIGPQSDRNPWGIGLIDRIPAMRPCHGPQQLPYRVPLQDLDQTYLACGKAIWPATGVPPADLWRALLVTAYTTGLRKSDLRALQWEDVDLTAGTIECTAAKTNKPLFRKLHPAAVTHLKRIGLPTGYLFRRVLTTGKGGHAYKIFRAIQRAAGVSRRFTFHDIRRTGASEVERVHPGLAEFFLQHTPQGVTAIYYLNLQEELDQAVSRMRMPASFTSPPPAPGLIRLAEISEHELPTLQNRGKWKFGVGRLKIARRWFPIKRGSHLAILRVLYESSDALTMPQICSRIRRYYPNPDALNGRIESTIAAARKELRQALALPDSIDPCPCVQSKPSAWTVFIPAAVLEHLESLTPAGEPSAPEYAATSLLYFGEVS